VLLALIFGMGGRAADITQMVVRLRVSRGPNASAVVTAAPARKFHQVGPDNTLRTNVYRVCSESAVGTIWSAGLHG
jgi:hypothetical protein